MDDVKQVIVIRKDLKCRAGKYAAMASHNSMMFITDKIQKYPGLGKYELTLTPEEEIWLLSGHFKKVVCQVDSENELLNLYDKAKEAGLTVYKIIDGGLTEFNNVMTFVSICIGPNFSSAIDPISSHLKLYQGSLNMNKDDDKVTVKDVFIIVFGTILLIGGIIAVPVSIVSGIHSIVDRYGGPEYSVKTGIIKGDEVKLLETIAKATNPHQDTGVVYSVRRDSFIVDFVELGRKRVKLEEIEVVK